MKKFFLVFFAGIVLLGGSATRKDGFFEPRKRMVKEQLSWRGIRDGRLLKAMEKVPRELFVPPALRERAYEDGPLPIGEGQTISQPYIVARMTELLELKGKERVLEIGTGSGYQAAILAELAPAGEVYTIEILPGLAKQAERRLKQLGYQNIYGKVGDGYLGWPDRAPFDAILLTAAPDEVPQSLLEQLKDKGVLVAPVGSASADQVLWRFHKENGKIKREEILPVRFVPMVHREKR